MRRLAAAIVVIAFLATIQLWAEDVRLQNGTMVPAAQGKAKVEHDRNRNLVVDIEVAHLAQPTALTPPANYYVVWFQPPDKEPELQGALAVNPETLQGSFKTTTPYKNFDVIVTAEENARPTTPSGTVVLKGSVATK